MNPKLLQRVVGMGMLNSPQYFQKVKNLFGSSLIGYWPLWETSGTVANDVVAGLNGAHVNMTLNNDISPTNKPAPFFTGTNSIVNLYTAGLAAAFDGLEGTFVFQAKFHPDAWTDGIVRQLYRIRADASNFIQIFKDASNVLQLQYVAGGSNKGVSLVTTATDYLTITMRWSKSGDKVLYDVNGCKMQAAITSLVAWVGALTTTTANLGGVTSTSGSYKGWGANALYINRFISDEESLALTKILDPQLKTLSIIGDSISVQQNSSLQPWDYRVFLAKRATLKNHAVSGNSIMGNMDAQVAAAAGDNADIIVCALGKNDNDAGDMAALQAEVESGIVALKASNPQSTLYYLNVLPCWLNNTTGAEIPKANTRTAIAAACTAQGITCWDSYSTPWILQSDTSDGTHPIAAGHAKIAAEVLARL